MPNKGVAKGSESGGKFDYKAGQ